MGEVERKRLVPISCRHRLTNCVCGHSEHIVKGLRADRIQCPKCDVDAAASDVVFGYMSALEFRGHTLNVESVVAFNGAAHRIRAVAEVRILSGRIGTGILRIAMQPLPKTSKSNEQITAPLADVIERKRRRKWGL